MTDGNETDGKGGPTAPIFVSYNHADRKVAAKVVELLEVSGFSVWWDDHIEPGERFQHITEQALENAPAIVVLWSKNSVPSPWVQDEATRGRERQCLVPVSIDGSHPPLGFRQFQYISLPLSKMRPGTSEAEQLVRRVSTMAARDNARPMRRKPAFAFDRRMVLLGGGAITALGLGAIAWRGGMSGSKPADGSLAVLPFANISGDAEQDYFAEGLSEELRATLSLNRQLSVAAKTSSNSFRGRSASAPEISRKLGVRYLLDGTVRRSSEIVRVTAQLIDGESGFEEWSDRFERPMADIFEVQSEISYLVADALVSRLSESGSGEFMRIGGTSNPAAYDAYLLGSATYASAVDEESDRKALAQFDRAIGLDPDYAAAHAARSRSLTFIANNYLMGSELSDYYDRSIDAARKAIQLAPGLAEAQAALGYTLFRGRLDVAAATDPYERSFELGFGDADILSGYANFAGRTGDFESARKAIARAKQLDPLNPAVFRDAGVIEYGARNFDAAIAEFRSALALNPGLSGVHHILGDIAYVRGDIEAARESYTREPWLLGRTTGIAQIANRQGDREAAEEALARVIGEFGENSLYQQAQIQAQRGETDLALSLLERAYTIGDAGMVQSRNDPMLDPLRNLPRFAEMLHKMGFSLPSGA
ncbi:MAG TPA: TIR domain-containing protein [Sphingomonadaceae bacterium]|nr:TIR domain-containing protein [Sphingomonadaceae bacterium]